MSFDITSLWNKGRGLSVSELKDPRVLMRIILGALLMANIVAAIILFKPWGASPEEMEQQLGQLRGELRKKQVAVERLRVLVSKSDQAREEGYSFMDRYFMDRRTASSTIISELKNAATEAGIEQKEQTFGFEPIEGSENLSMMTISGNYEGSYPDLVKFINGLDRSPRFLIVDTLAASPERTAGLLSVTCKLNAFVIEGRETSAPAEAEQSVDMAEKISQDRTERSGADSGSPPAGPDYGEVSAE